MNHESYRVWYLLNILLLNNMLVMRYNVTMSRRGLLAVAADNPRANVLALGGNTTINI